MSDEDKDILAADGWIIVCHSPFELEHPETGSTATGIGARYVLDFLRSEAHECRMR